MPHANSKGTDQPAHSRSLISTFVVCCLDSVIPLLAIRNFKTLASLISCARWFVGWFCWGLTSQSTIFQSCRDGAIASWVINQYFRGVKCLAQGHNSAAVGLEPRTSRSGVRHSTTEPPRSPKDGLWLNWSQTQKTSFLVTWLIYGLTRESTDGQMRMLALWTWSDDSSPALYEPHNPSYNALFGMARLEHTEPQTGICRSITSSELGSLLDQHTCCWRYGNVSSKENT